MDWSGSYPTAVGAGCSHSLQHCLTHKPLAVDSLLSGTRSLDLSGLLVLCFGSPPHQTRWKLSQSSQNHSSFQHSHLMSLRIFSIISHTPMRRQLNSQSGSTCKLVRLWQLRKWHKTPPQSPPMLYTKQVNQTDATHDRSTNRSKSNRGYARRWHWDSDLLRDASCCQDRWQGMGQNISQMEQHHNKAYQQMVD